MPAPKKGPRFGRIPRTSGCMLANLAAHLFEAEGITTTEAKAKALRPYVEKLITKAQEGGVHKQRQVVSTIHDKDVTHKLFADIAPALHRPQRRLHADPEARPAPGRQRAHGAHRVRVATLVRRGTLRRVTLSRRRPAAVRIVVAYDGTELQRVRRATRPATRTVGGVLGRGDPARCCGTRSSSRCAGRTDAGVHAAGQVVSFAVAARRSIPMRLQPRCQRRCSGPKSSCASASSSPPGFDARARSATLAALPLHDRQPAGTRPVPRPLRLADRRSARPARCCASPPTRSSASTTSRVLPQGPAKARHGRRVLESRWVDERRRRAALRDPRQRVLLADGPLDRRPARRRRRRDSAGPAT